MSDGMCEGAQTLSPDAPANVREGTVLVSAEAPADGHRDPVARFSAPLPMAAVGAPRTTSAWSHSTRRSRR